MAGEWRDLHWGDIATLEYGKSLRSYEEQTAAFRVYGTNGPIGWHDKPLSSEAGVIIGRKGANRGIHFSPEPFFVIDTAFYLKRKTEIDFRWAYYCLLTYDINGMDSGSAIPSTSRDDFYALRVKVPPLPEQQAIACILGALDDKIELNRKMNRTLDTMARTIFHSWFIDFDPVKAKAAGQNPHGLKPEIASLFPDSFQDSDLGPIPKGWRECRWGDISTLEYGKSFRGYAESQGSFQVYGTNGPIGWHDESLSDFPGVVIGRKGAYRGIHYSPRPFFVIDTAFYLSPKVQIDMKWAYYELLRYDLNGMDSGSAIPSTSRADFYTIPVILPPEVLHQAYGKLTQTMFDRRDKTESENEKLTSLRDALLPKLISGELRVPDAERIVGRCV